MLEQILSYKTQFCNIVTTISYAFSPVMNKSLHAVLVKVFSRRDPLFHSCYNSITAETHHPPPRCAHIHCLVSIHVQQALLNVNRCSFFFPRRNSMTRLYFFPASMAAAILSDCPPAAVCHMETNCNGILVRRFNLYCHLPLTLWANVIK